MSLILCFVYCLVFFFFKQKTAYEMRISDWSSDVCSSDLKGDRSGQFVTLASGFEGDDGALPIRADARVLGATIKAGESLTHSVGEGRHAYLVAATGAIEIDGVRFDARDGAALSGGQTVARSEEHTSELQSLMRRSYAVFCLKKNKLVHNK